MNEQRRPTPAPAASPGPHTSTLELLDRTLPPFSLVASAGARSASWLEKHGRRLVVLIPFLWLLLFFLVPFLIVLKLSFSEPMLAQPPYVPLLELADEAGG